MLVAQASKTAMMAAVLRGQHRRLNAHPWVFDDPYALALVGSDWSALWERLCEVAGDPVVWGATGSVTARARHTEHRLLAGPFTQYVILGAGLDSFGWRRPDLLGSLRVFEVDHPATQAWKRERAETLGLPGDDVVLVPVDFESQRFQDGLDAAGFDPSAPTLFSWLGVAPYLTVEAIKATLRSVAGCAPGSEIVFDYLVTDEHWDPVSRRFMDTFGAIAADAGEPPGSALSPVYAETLVDGCGLAVSEHLDRDDLTSRYFAGRDDGLAPLSCIRLITATRQELT